MRGRFKDPKLQAEAIAKAKGKPRPNRMSRAKIVRQAKIELVKDELLRDGYLRMVRQQFPSVLKAHFRMAKSDRNAGVQERKMLFEATEVLQDKKADAIQTIADVLADLVNMPE